MRCLEASEGQILCNYSTPPPPHEHASMDTYTIHYIHTIPAPTPWIPSHTIQLQGDLPTPLTHNNTQQHTTTHHNTQQHYTTALGYIKQPMYLLFLWLGIFQGPKKSWFSGPTPSNAPRSDVAPLKIITYRAIKTTGALIVNFYLEFLKKFKVLEGIQKCL